VLVRSRTGLVADDGAVGDGGVALVDDERDVEGGLEGGLVEGGEGAARVGGFELRDGVIAPGGLREIEAAECSVENAAVLDAQRRFAGRKLIGNRESGLLLVGIEGDGSSLFLARGGDFYGLEGEVVGVEADAAGRLGEGDVNGFGATEGGGFETGRESQGVALGKDGVRKALGLCDGGCNKSANK